MTPDMFSHTTNFWILTLRSFASGAIRTEPFKRSSLLGAFFSASPLGVGISE